MSKNRKSSKGNFKILKAIGRGIYKLFSKIYRIIDKLIVTPITKLMLWITKPFTTNNKPFDRLLNNRAFLLTFSLAIAFLAFFTIDNLSDTLASQSAEVLYNRTVTALYNEEAYVIEGLPDKVDVTMIGKSSDLYLARQYPSEDVVVDLRQLKPGSHRVTLKYNGSISSVDYKIDPSNANIVIYEKVSTSKSLDREILNADKIDNRYNINSITFSRDEVYVKGAQYRIDQIAIVKAMVNLEDLVNPTVGTNTLTNVPLIAFDKDGNKIEDVEIVPETIDATIEIGSTSKEVPIDIVPTGEIAFGRAIESITSSVTKVTIYGDEEALSRVTSIPLEVNVNGIDKNTELSTTIIKPAGVTTMSASTATISIVLSTIQEKTLDNINIETRNLGAGLTAQAASQNDTAVSVIVKGTSTNLNYITADDLTAYVDLSGLGAGTHKVEVKVTGTNKTVSYTPKTTTVTIIIQ